MSPIMEEFSSFEGPSGHTLHEIKWSHPDKEPKGLVFLCHGYDEHMQYYEEIGRQLADNGFIAFGHDHPGHGKSSGNYLQTDSFEKDYVDNVIFSCKSKSKEYPQKLPIYIIGHSMGGLITSHVLIKQHNMFKAAVLMAAALELPPENTGPWKVAGVKFINYFIPSCPVGRLSLEEITRDEERLDLIKKDPLRGRAATKAGFAVSFIEEIKEVTNRLNEINTPILIQHGEMDKIIPPSASELIFKSISSQDKNKHIYPEAFHNLYQEISDVRIEAIQEAVQWIVNHN